MTTGETNDMTDTPTAEPELRQRIEAAVAVRAQQYTRLADDIWDFAETGFAEHRVCGGAALWMPYPAAAQPVKHTQSRA
ncbi:amidohydrolase [Frigidibacter mobilis]|nr:amidohydrolase [Frigidibacter mobilis]